MTGENWPAGADIRFRGELPPLFDGETQTLPFEVSLPLADKAARRDVQLVAPPPSLWVKAVRVFRGIKPQPMSGVLGATCELDVTFPIRRVQKQQEAYGSVTFVDADGKEVEPNLPRISGGEGGLSDLFGNFPAMQFALDQAPFEFVTRHALWDNGIAKAAPNLWARQTFVFNFSTPLVLTVSIQRDRKLLEGEVSPREWKIEPAAPTPN